MARCGVGNGLCIPAGPLRAPLEAQFEHTDALVIVGDGAAGARVSDLARGQTIVHASLVPDPDAAARLHGQRVVAFAGIGRPDKFFETLTRLGAEIAAARAFADHHAYSARDMAELRAEAKRLSAVLVTTEKDPHPHRRRGRHRRAARRDAGRGARSARGAGPGGDGPRKGAPRRSSNLAVQFRA